MGTSAGARHWKSVGVMPEDETVYTRVDNVDEKRYTAASIRCFSSSLHGLRLLGRTRGKALASRTEW